MFRRYKRRDGRNVGVEGVVLVHKDLPRNTWPLGVVDELPGGDGAVRAARVRTNEGITTRPITKLYPMKINCGVEHLVKCDSGKAQVNK